MLAPPDVGSNSSSFLDNYKQLGERFRGTRHRLRASVGVNRPDKSCNVHGNYSRQQTGAGNSGSLQLPPRNSHTIHPHSEVAFLIAGFQREIKITLVPSTFCRLINKVSCDIGWKRLPPPPKQKIAPKTNIHAKYS